MDSDTDRRFQPVWPFVGCDGSLRCNCRQGGLFGGRERSHRGVLDDVHLAPAHPFEHASEQLSVLLEERAKDLWHQFVGKAHHSPPLGHNDRHRARKRNLLVDRPRRGEGARQPFDHDLKDSSGRSMSFSLCSPRSRTVTPEISSSSMIPAVERESSTWPPCAIVQIRAARWTPTPT